MLTWRGMLAVCIAAELLAGEAYAEAPPPSADKPKVAVMPLKAKRVEDEVVEIMGSLLVASVDASQRYQVIGADEILAVLDVEGMKDKLGCTDVACMAEIGGALNARYTLQGSVGRLGTQVVISLTLFDNQRVEVASRCSVSIPADENYYASGVSGAVAQLFGMDATSTAAATPLHVATREAPTPAAATHVAAAPAPAKRPLLRVESSPRDSSVFINEVYAGQTPFEKELEPGTTVALVVEKAGHSVYKRTIDARAGEDSKHKANLMNIEEAESARSSRQVLAWVAVITSLVAFVPTGFLIDMGVRALGRISTDSSASGNIVDYIVGIVGGLFLGVAALTFLPIGIVMLASTPDVPDGPTHLHLAPGGQTPPASARLRAAPPGLGTTSARPSVTGLALVWVW